MNLPFGRIGLLELRAQSAAAVVTCFVRGGNAIDKKKEENAEHRQFV
jgi:hypothetical protein